MYKKGDWVIFSEDEFMYRVFMIKEVDDKYYTTSYIKQSSNGFKVRIKREYVMRHKQLTTQYKLMSEERRNAFKTWIFSWIFHNPKGIEIR